jgi:hypothetical protein
MHEIDKSTANSIPVASNGRNILPEDAEKNVIEWEETHGSTNLGRISIERCKLGLIGMDPYLMKAITTWLSSPRKRIPKKRSKLQKVRGQTFVPSHPGEGNILITKKSHSGVELLNVWNIVVALNLHQMV